MLGDDIVALCADMNNSDLHVAPRIPPKKLANLMSTASVPADVTVYALIDTTTFGSAKNGMLFTDRGLYLHNDLNLMPGAHFVSWDELLATQGTPYPKRLPGIGRLALTPLVHFEFAGCSLDGHSSSRY